MPITYVYVVATSQMEAESLAAKGDATICLKDYGDAMRILKEINKQAHRGTRYGVFSVMALDNLDGR